MCDFFGPLMTFAATVSSDWSADYSGIVEATETGLQNVASNGMTLIGNLVPVAVGVAGAVIVVRLGMRVFRSIAGR